MIVIVAGGVFSVTVSVKIIVSGGGRPPVDAAAAAPPSTGTMEYGSRRITGCGIACDLDSKEDKNRRKPIDKGDRISSFAANI